jgi:hypothetical protein
MINKSTNSKNLRVIKTVRNIKDINDGVKKGFKPLMKSVVPSNKIQKKYAVLQSKITGEIQIIGDYRADPYFFNESSDEFEKVIDWSYYYPHSFESPYAAYLLPPDLKINERVFLEDLIEDVVGLVWNQGDTFRLPSVEAVWNGKDFELDYQKMKDIIEIIG